MDRCPCCMARLTEGALICPRCQANLAGIKSCEQRAQHWLEQAVRFWFEHEPKLALQTLIKSLRLKQTSAALLFGDFISRQQVRTVLALLAQRELTEAKQLLSLLLELQPSNELFKQLQGFSGYLSASIFRRDIRL